MEEKNKTWSDFIQDNLLNTGFIDGLLLLTSNLEPVYKYGKLEDLPAAEFIKFHELFDAIYSESNYQNKLVSGLTLSINGEALKFVLRHLSYTTAHAVTKGNKFGVVAVKLSFGYILASHSYPVSSHVVACLVDDVVKLLT